MTEPTPGAPLSVPVGSALLAALQFRQQERKSARELIEQRLGLPPNLLDDLRKDEDWTFVVRLHALVESILNHAIVERLGFPGLASPIAFLSTSDSRAGKLEIGIELAILGKPQAAPVRALSQIRNWMVHDVRNVGRTLTDCLADPTVRGIERRKALIKAFTFQSRESADPMIHLLNEKFFLQQPKVVIHAQFLSWMAQMELKLQMHTLERQQRENLLEYANEMIRSLDQPSGERDNDNIG